MRRFIFALFAIVPVTASSQAAAIPGRDLLTFPIGLTAEAPALATQTGSGIWNPATTVLADGNRWRIAAASLSTPSEVAVTGQLATAATTWKGTTIGASMLRAAVGNLLRTDTDPQSIGDEIPYSTVVLSASLARRFTPNFSLGVAYRSRTGTFDNVSRTASSVDVGVVLDHLTALDLKFGAATFLAGGKPDIEHTSLLLAADIRLAGNDTAKTVRAGYSGQYAKGLMTETFAYATARYGIWEARGGPVRTEIFGGTNTRLRLGLAVHYAGYIVGVAREESAGGLAPTYQFSLSTLLR
jgi:hypothetical protein